MVCITILISKTCPAGQNILFFLKNLKLPVNVKIHEYDGYCVSMESIDKQLEGTEFEGDIYIFATTHTSKSGKPSFCVHVPGNWGIAGLGGKDNWLCTAPVFLMRKAFFEVIKACDGINYEPIMEVTHHGPYLEKPCFFMEIGSGSDAWTDIVAGNRMAKAIFNTVSGLVEEPENILPAIGIGGQHNVSVLSKYVIRNQIALGHVIAKHSLENFSREKLLQAIQKTVPKAKLVVVDWKGISGYKNIIRETLDKLCEEGVIEWKRSDKM